MGPGSSFTGSTAATPPPRRYTLLRRLAIGGMGELLLARAAGARGVQKLVAIKRVRPEYATDPEFVSMFVNEARLAATLDHPNVVRTYDLVEDESAFFMVMEYLHGESLGRLLNAVSGRGERVPLAHIVSIVLGVAAGLHCAHERRGVDGQPLDIVHRDLSPGNVFITYEGGVKLLDFGIAKATSRTSITIGPSRKGKVSYMSPEQCVGADIDRRSDIFALGVVMWELCTGRRLFLGDNEFAIMNQITTTTAPPPLLIEPELPPTLSDIIIKALAPERAARFQTAMELHDAVEATAIAEGLLPSAPALGRYLEQTCGLKDLPSAEPSDEFMRTEATLVARSGAMPVPAAPPQRRWSLVLALAGGATLGAIAVGASSSDSVVAAEHREGTQVLQRVQPEPPAKDAAPQGVVEPEPLGAGVVAEPAPEDRQEKAAAPPPADEASARGKPRKRQGSKRGPRRRKADAKPSEPVRGVDGLLPRE
jgi:serine/threonine protein kinase